MKVSFSSFCFFTALIFGILILLQIFGVLTLNTNLLGQGDFYAYFAASELLFEGKNPYDQGLLSARQAELGYDEAQTRPLLALYVPAFYVLLWPLTTLPYESAAVVWALFSGALLLISSALAWHTVEQKALNPVLIVILSVFYLPVLDVFLEGQVTFILLFGAASFFYCMQKRNLSLAGLSLLPFLLKPHLGLLLLLLWLYSVWSMRNVRAIFWPVFAALLLLLLPEMFIEGIHMAWVFGLKDTAPLTATASLTSQMLALFSVGNMRLISGLVSVFVCIGVVVFFQRQNGLAGLRDHVPLFLALAPALAPYAWVSDHALGVLVPIVVAALSFREDCQTGNRARVRAAALIIGGQFAWLAFFLLFVSSSAGFALYVCVPCLIWILGRPKLVSG